VIVALLIVALQTTAPSASPTLADVARRERTRQKTATSESVFTNESVHPEVEPPSPPDKPAAETLKPPDSEAGGAAAPAAEHNEAWWRDAFSKARDDVKHAEDRVKVLQLELNRLNTDLLTRSDIYNRENVLGPQITAKNLELAGAEKDADQARAKVTKLEDDLRHAGAPIGWSR
jgi:hypothetical protein